MGSQRILRAETSHVLSPLVSAPARSHSHAKLDWKDAFARRIPQKRLHRQAYRRKACTRYAASSNALARSSQDQEGTPHADQDLFLIAGAGIGGLAMAAALSKV